MTVFMETPKRKAFAFSITIWIVALLMLATAIILRFAKDEVEITQALRDKLQTQLMAQDILELLKFYIPTSDYSSIGLNNELLNSATPYSLPNAIIVDGREYNLSQNISFSLRDTSAMLNILYSSSSTIAKSLIPNNNKQLEYRLDASLTDWRDLDNVKTINGAEQHHYSMYYGNNFKIRNNQAIQDIHELALIQGFNEINFQSIHNNLYYGEPSSINLGLITNVNYFATVLGLTNKEAKALLLLREKNFDEFQRTVYYLKGFNDEYMGFWLSKQFIVTIKVNQGYATSILKTLISFNNLTDKPYNIITYTLN